MRITLRIVLALLIALLPIAASADEAPAFSVLALPFAKHYGTTSTYQFNSVLKGAALLVPLDRSGSCEGYALHYTNSFYISTNSAGIECTPLQVGPLRVGFLAGITNKGAYPYSPVKPFIGGVLVKATMGRHSAVDFIVTPCGAGSWCKAAVAVGYEQGFGRR